jgi:manganese transport protein
MLGLVLLGFLYDFLQVGLEVPGFAAGLVPSFAGTESVLLAVGILGATVMPHVVYLHSALTQRRIPARDEGERRELLRFTRLDVIIAMGVAGLINMTMLVVRPACSTAPARPRSTRSRAPTPASRRCSGAAPRSPSRWPCSPRGLSSSSVGTYSGQVVMQGFIRRRIPLFLRRALTMAPALIVLGLGFDPTSTLVISQVVLSFGIPFALVPTILLTRRGDLMGGLVSRPLTTAVASLVAALILNLNVFLLYGTFFG